MASVMEVIHLEAAALVVAVADMEEDMGAAVAMAVLAMADMAVDMDLVDMGAPPW